MVCVLAIDVAFIIVLGTREYLSGIIPNYCRETAMFYKLQYERFNNLVHFA